MQEKTLLKPKHRTSNIHSSDFGSVSYDIFGSPYQKTGSFLADDSLDFGYLGKPYNADKELYDYGFRDYSPTIARFTTVDPIRDGRNWYCYVVNDPVNYVDLWGLCGSDGGNKKESFFSIEIFVDQPGSGNDRDTYEYKGGTTFETGHAFIRLTNNLTNEKITAGFYPDYSNNNTTAKDVVLGKSVPGFVNDDSNYDLSKVDVYVKFDITEEQYNNAKSYIETVRVEKKQYNLSKFNCTDFALGTASSAEINLPDTKGYWPTGSGSNPGDLGEDLREKYLKIGIDAVSYADGGK